MQPITLAYGALAGLVVVGILYGLYRHCYRSTHLGFAESRYATIRVPCCVVNQPNQPVLLVDREVDVETLTRSLFK